MAHPPEEPPQLEARVAALFCHPEASEASFERRCIPPGESVRVGLWGLEGSADFNTTRRWTEYGLEEDHRGDRAVSVQTSANLTDLHRARLELAQELTEAELKPGLFGENVFLDSPVLTASQACVGDEFAVFRAGVEQRLRLQVSGPRCPCNKVDDRVGKTYTACGARAHCAVTGHAGFFFRVLEPGDLRVGDVVRLSSRRYPRWDLARICRLLYGHPTAVMLYKVRGRKAFVDRTTPAVLREEWMGTEEELLELASIEELGILEFREHLWKMLGWPGIGRYSQPRCRRQADARAIAAVGVVAAAILAFGAMRALSRAK